MKFILTLNRWYFLIVFILGMLPWSPIREIFGGIYTVLAFFWIYSFSIYGQKKLETKGLHYNTNLLNAVVWIVPISFAIALSLGKFLLDANSPMGVALFCTLILSAGLGILYLYYFSSRTLSSLQKERKVNMNDVGMNFFLFGMTILGMMVLQPKLKALLDLKDDK